MKGGKTPYGYTIIELMIVLAISGLMFLIAANFISDKQGETAFTQGINDFATDIQSVLETVNNGQYTDIDINCRFNGSNVSFGGAVKSQGQNPECIFLGKVIHFQENTGGGEPAKHYEVFSLAGGRQNLANLILADPTVIPDLVSHEVMPQNLDIKRVLVDGTPSYGLAFLQDLGTLDPVTATIADGSRSIKMYYVLGLGPNSTSAAAENNINLPGRLRLAQTAIICVSDDKRYAAITVGDNKNQLSVKVKRVNKGSAECP